ncbi:MAG: CAP domain-containing protein [Steroidobacteraceae bacterium]
MHAPSAALLTLIAWTAAGPAGAVQNLMSAIHSIRAQGCDGRSGVATALRPDPQLNRAAQALASGRKLRDAMNDSGYRAVQSAVLEASGSDAAIIRALAERGCEDIADPVYRDVGLAEQDDAVWIVLAAPFVPPQRDEAQAVSRRLLELVNQARAERRRCGWKRFDAAPPLLMSEVLERAALAHARDMARQKRLSHVGSDGSTHALRATRAGYVWRTIGENIAAGQATPELVVAGWLKSAGHCTNLMDPDFSEMGVAYVREPDSTAGIYWVQLLGTPQR